MATFFSRVVKVIDESDIIIEVLDARFPDLTRNDLLEKIVEDKGKRLVLVLNKCDLISKSSAEKIKRELEKEYPTIYISVKDKMGKFKIKEIIGKISKNKETTVCIMGYPNVGKSSLINYLTGRKVAKTSITAGFTKGEQLVKMTKTIKLFDLPGVIPTDEWDEFQLVLTASKNANQIKEPELVAQQLVEYLYKKFPGSIKKTYGIDPNEDGEETLEKIALKFNKLKKGGEPNTMVISKQVLMDWQKGKLKIEP